jgi:predicted SAM-dependent methyltransferase
MTHTRKRTIIVTLAIAAASIVVLLLALTPRFRQRYPLESAILRSPLAAVRDLRRHLHTYWMVASSRSIIQEYLQTHDAPKLQLGAGPYNLPGWLNTDIEPGPGQAYLDATKTFPLPDRRFHYVTSEQLFEHLPYEDGLAMLRECYRVLKPGGRIRIATPNLSTFVRLFQPGQTAEAIQYLAGKQRRWQWPKQQTDQCALLNIMFHSFGHRSGFLYDPETLSRSLTSTGFQSVQQFPAGESNDPVLKTVDARPGGVYKEANQYETMVFEAVRPAD